jgi:hypothetical protein
LGGSKFGPAITFFVKRDLETRLVGSPPRDANDNFGLGNPLVGIYWQGEGKMKAIVTLALASLLLTSAAGCSSCKSWFGWNKGASCDQPQECGYGAGAPVMGSGVYLPPGPVQ